MGGQNSTICGSLCLRPTQNNQQMLLLRHSLSSKEFLSSIQGKDNSSLSTARSNDCQTLNSQILSPEDSDHLATASGAYNRGEYQQAINCYMLALHDVQKKDTKLAVINYAIADCYFKLGKMNRALKHCKLAEEKYIEILGRNSEDVAMTSSLLGHIQSKQNDYELAMYYYEKSYRIYNSQSEKDYQSLFEVGFNRASLHLNLGQYQEAYEKYEQIEELLQKDVAGESTLLELYRCKSLCCFKIEQIAKAYEYLRKALQLLPCLSNVSKQQIAKLVEISHFLEGPKRDEENKGNNGLSAALKRQLSELAQHWQLQ